MRLRARLEYHHSSDVQTIIARARDLQDIRERWTVPTFMDGSSATRRFRPGSRKVDLTQRYAQVTET